MIRIEDIKTTMVVDRNSAQLLVDALLSYANSLTKDRDGCKCSYCEKPEQRAKKILDIYFEAYPLSRVARNAIGIPTLKDIEDKLAHQPPESQLKEGDTKNIVNINGVQIETDDSIPSGMVYIKGKE